MASPQVNRATRGPPQINTKVLAQLVSVNRATIASPQINRVTMASPQINRVTTASPQINRAAMVSPQVDRATRVPPQINYKELAQLVSVDRATRVPPQINFRELAQWVSVNRVTGAPPRINYKELAVTRHSRDISRRTVHGQTNAHTDDVLQPSKIAVIVPSLWLACLRRRVSDGSGKSRTFRGAKPRRGPRQGGGKHGTQTKALK